MDLVLRNIPDLNGLVGEGPSEVVVKDANEARFSRASPISVTFYRDGFRLDNQVRRKEMDIYIERSVGRPLS